MSVSSPWPSQTPYPRQHLSEFLRQTAEREPDTTALIGPDERPYSFGRVWQASRRIARMLQENGVSKGQTVGIFAPNCPEYVPAFHGILLAGGVVTPVNPLYRERELAFQLQDSGAVGLFAARSLLPLVDVVRADVPSLRHTCVIEDLWDLAADISQEPEPVPIEAEKDLAVLPYSSGTTGLPKGVMLSHYNLACNVRQHLTTDLAQPEAVSLDFLPFDHIYGLTVVMNTGLANASVQVIIPSFDAQLVLYLVHKYSVTDLFVVPPALLSLVYFAEQGQRYDVSSLRFMLSGAAALPAELAEEAQRIFSCPVIQGYGLTETSPTTNVNPLARAKPASVGPPVADTLEQVVDPATGQEVAPGEAGDLLVQGPQVMLGYWNQPEATAAAFPEQGWLRTGDVCRIDEDGYLYVLDRSKEVIKYKGYQVAPVELEAVLLEHPSVLDAAVIPKPDPALGEIPKAFVVIRPGRRPSRQDIMQFVADRVAPYKRIREVEFVWEIPKSATGKILRRELIERERAAREEELV